MKMTPASSLRLLTLYLILASGLGIIIDFTFSGDDSNTVLLMCIDEATNDNEFGAMIDIFDSSSDQVPSRSLFVGVGGATFSVTPENEAFLRCSNSAGTDVSNRVAIAAVPQSSYDPRTMRVFNDEPAELTCGIPLGRLSGFLEPYDFSWDVLQQTQFIPVNSSLLSENNRILTVQINNSTRSNQYRCKLRLKRCNVVMCSPQTHDGSQISFEVFEKIKLISRPKQQEVHAGQIASFFCVGSGSSLQITWQVCVDSCVDKMSTNESRSGDSINATLMVDTSSLPLSEGDVTVEIRCIMCQNSLPLEVRNSSFSTGLTIISTPSVTVETTTASISTTVIPTTNGTGTSPPTTGDNVTRIWIISVTVIIGALAFILAVVSVLVIWKFTCKKGKYIMPPATDDPATDDPDIDPTVPLHKPNRLYEELPESIHIIGTEKSEHPLKRQHGIEYDHSNPKADNFSCHESDYSKSGGGSDLSGLSGVSGNVPGAHKMPTYSQDNSVVSEGYFLIPPPSGVARNSDTTINTTQTRSTIVPPIYHPEHYRSATEVCHNGQAHPFPANRSASYGNVNYEAVFVKEQHQLYANPPTAYGPTPSHSHASVSSVHSRHSGSQQHASQQLISDITLLRVMNCLMHNRDCEILYCPCRQIQERYKHLEAAKVPLQQMKSPERKYRKPNVVLHSSSTESDSDVPDNCLKKAKMRLKLHDDKKLHPHYHISTKSHLRRLASSNVDSHRRSRSMSDLTPIKETRETPTPQLQVGGAIKAGTPIHCDKILGETKAPTKEELLQHTALTQLSMPCPPLLREISLSSDNLPVLCLNNCPLQLKTPSPIKSRHNIGRISSKPSLKPVCELSNGTETDDSNTSSRSDSSAENEAAKSDDNDEEIGVSLTAQLSYWKQPLNNSVRREESSGYDSEPCTVTTNTVDSYQRDLPLLLHDQVSPALRRSCSPFETETTVSSDGTVIKTTEC